MLPKLKYEHVRLTSYSKMRVDLASQVNIKCESTATYAVCLHFRSLVNQLQMLWNLQEEKKLVRQ